jgi:hypothetical protein
VVRRLGAVCSVLISGLAAASCAIPTQQAPNGIPANRVPFGLLNHQLPTTTTTPPKPSVPVKIFLLGANQSLVAETRLVQVPAALSAVVDSLLNGPIRTEEAAGITTAIPNNVQVVSTTVTKTPELVTVNFNDAFAQITGGATELAVAQVVATVVTQTGYGTGVFFEIGGVPTNIPIASGAEVPGPVYLWQFLTSAP